MSLDCLFQKIIDQEVPEERPHFGDDSGLMNIDTATFNDEIQALGAKLTDANEIRKKKEAHLSYDE